MKKKFLKIEGVLLALALTVGAFVLTKIVIYRHIAVDDAELQSRYEEKKEKCELLERIADVCIEEGKGINTDKIPSNDIRYEIRYNAENIIFSYYIQEENLSKKTYKANIKLSTDYKILQATYSTELEDFETFRTNSQWLPQILSSLYAIVAVLLIYICILLFCISIMRMKKRKDNNKAIVS